MSFREQLINTAHAYVAAHSNRDLPAIIALCSPSCTHRGGPSTVAQPTRNNDEYSAMHVEVFKMIVSYNAKVTDLVVDEVARKVALSIHATGVFTVGEYDNEYIITLTMTEDGKLVQDQYDFIDSVRMNEFMAKMGSFQQDVWEGIGQNGNEPE